MVARNVADEKAVVNGQRSNATTTTTTISSLPVPSSTVPNNYDSTRDSKETRISMNHEGGAPHSISFGGRPKTSPLKAQLRQLETQMAISSTSSSLKNNNNSYRQSAVHSSHVVIPRGSLRQRHRNPRLRAFSHTKSILHNKQQQQQQHRINQQKLCHVNAMTRSPIMRAQNAPPPLARTGTIFHLSSSTPS
jgi:hypothetical protein